MTESGYAGAQFGPEGRTELCGGAAPKQERETSCWMTSVPVCLSEGCTARHTSVRSLIGHQERCYRVMLCFF